MHMIWPWQDRDQHWSWLKAGTFALMFAPGLWLINQVAPNSLGRCRSAA